MLGVIALFSVLALTAFADEKFPGPCPSVPALVDFDLEKFSERTWYLVESSEHKSKRCIAYDFQTESTKTWTVTGINKKGVEFNKTHTFTENEGNFTVTEHDGDTEFFLVIAGDYENYTVFYQCEEKKNAMHEEDVLILASKDRLADLTSFLPHVHEILKNTTLNVKTFFPINHDNCTTTLPSITTPTPPNP